MPKRTYPDQDGLRLYGLGDGFINMGQLYTLLEDWEAIIDFLLCYPWPQLNPTGVLVFTLLWYWFFIPKNYK
jgi:hypothetical protein